MCQATIEGLSNRFESCQVQKVASLLTEALRLHVNGKLISPTEYSYNAATDKLAYKPARLPKGKRTVKIQAKDAVGNTGTRSWSFTIS